MNDASSPLNSPAAIRAQASALLATIEGASNLGELLRATGGAKGFVLGLETVYPLTAIDVQNLYVMVEAVAQRRHAKLGG
ncbi:hypothetical protein [Pseudomonas koreensis]|uniref:hypothetical protein n=1 Tax=Pseudomonas koreensis TaxID=198620 RepID=UPI00382ACD62